MPWGTWWHMATPALPIAIVKILGKTATCKRYAGGGALDFASALPNSGDAWRVGGERVFLAALGLLM